MPNNFSTLKVEVDQVGKMSPILSILYQRHSFTLEKSEVKCLSVWLIEEVRKSERFIEFIIISSVHIGQIVFLKENYK